MITFNQFLNFLSLHSQSQVNLLRTQATQICNSTSEGSWLIARLVVKLESLAATTRDPFRSSLQSCIPRAAATSHSTQKILWTLQKYLPTTWMKTTTSKFWSRGFVLPSNSQKLPRSELTAWSSTNRQFPDVLNSLELKWDFRWFD